MQVDQIKFVINKFESFTAKKSFALGTTGHSIVEGGEVLFDGSTVIINEQRIPYPNLRGAVKMGWLVLTADYDEESVVAPASANIQVRAAIGTQQNASQPATKSMIATVQSDERVVMTQSQRQEMRKELTTMKRASSGTRTEGHAGSAHEGVELKRTFRTPARSETKLTADTAGLAIREVDTVKIDPGEGLSEGEYLSRLSEEEREEYLVKKGAAKAAHVAELEEKGLVTPFAKINSKTAGTKTVDGITATVTTGGGTEIADLSGMDTGGNVSSSVVAEGMTFRNLNGPKRAFQMPQAPSEPESKIGKDGTADMRKRIAKAICADFPEDYSFDEHWKRRLSRLHLHYAERPDVLRAVFAAESDDFKRVLLEEFPEAFQS